MKLTISKPFQVAIANDKGQADLYSLVRCEFVSPTVKAAWILIRDRAIHTVEWHTNGKWTCCCGAFQYRRRDGACKHTRAMKGLIDAIGVLPT